MACGPWSAAAEGESAPVDAALVEMFCPDDAVQPKRCRTRRQRACHRTPHSAGAEKRCRSEVGRQVSRQVGSRLPRSAWRVAVPGDRGRWGQRPSNVSDFAWRLEGERPQVLRHPRAVLQDIGQAARCRGGGRTGLGFIGQAMRLQRLGNLFAWPLCTLSAIGLVVAVDSCMVGWTDSSIGAYVVGVRALGSKGGPGGLVLRVRLASGEELELRDATSLAREGDVLRLQRGTTAVFRRTEYRIQGRKEPVPAAESIGTPAAGR